MLRLTLVISIFTIKSSYGQFENTETGARPVALNGAFTSLSDNSLAVFYNPGGLGQLINREVSAFYNPSVLGISELATASLTYAEPMKIGTFGFGLKTFGFDLYRETNAVFSYGNKFKDKIFYGFSLNYFFLNIQNYNSASTIGIDAGVIAYLTEFLKWGFTAKNINGAKIGESKQKLTQTYRSGLTFIATNNLSLNFEIEKDIRYPFSFRGAMEYSINRNVDLRTGVGSEPVSFSGGVGLSFDIVRIDYALTHLNDLGMSNHFSVSVKFH